jgi:hypothetical protein
MTINAVQRKTYGDAARCDGVKGFAAAVLLLSTLGSAYNHISLPAAAAGTHQPLAPIEDVGAGAVPNGHLGGIGLDLMAGCKFIR